MSKTVSLLANNAINARLTVCWKHASHLPVIVCPSHAAGRADLVPSLAFASTAAGADGLLVEVHPDPAHALCDGRQSLTPDEFAAMAKTCQDIRSAMKNTLHY